MTIAQFFALLGAHPWSIVACLLDCAVIFVNGWTDGPNSIATCVTTRAMRPRNAVIMAAILNFIGVIAIGLISSLIVGYGDVSQTIAKIAIYPSSISVDKVMVAVSAGLFSIVCFSLGSAKIGFPSSESNALVGGMTGGAMAIAVLQGEANWFSYVGWDSWAKVLYGFFGSLFLGFLLGFAITKLIEVICRKMRRGPTTRFFAKGEIASAGLMSFVHGMQDGAKFIGVFILIAALLGSADGSAYDTSALAGVWWMYVPVALIMGGGTCVGGYNIIKKLGSDMAHLEKYQGFATDLASIVSLLLVTFLGIPVSTGTVKSTAIVGGGAAKSWRRVHWDVAGKMVGSWILIFPVTALIAFLFTCIFIWTV